jgi:hypothetical protein
MALTKHATTFTFDGSVIVRPTAVLRMPGVRIALRSAPLYVRYHDLPPALVTARLVEPLGALWV